MFLTITVFVYLQIKNLPKGATIIDYAYMIHTEIGNKMVAAKVLSLLLTGALPFHHMYVLGWMEYACVSH